MRKYFPALEKLLKGNYEEQSLSVYKIMQLYGVTQGTAERLKETLPMKIKEAKFLKKHAEEIEIEDPKLIPIVLYLLKDYNYFKSTSELMDEIDYSRYMIKQAKDAISLYIEEHLYK